MRWELHRHDDL